MLVGFAHDFVVVSDNKRNLKEHWEMWMIRKKRDSKEWKPNKKQYAYGV